MQTLGFTCGYAGSVILDQYFKDQVPGSTYPVVSSYLIMPATATVGSVVFENSAGQLFYLPTLLLGYNPVAAVRILSSGIVDGVERFTTADPISWLGSVNV